MDVVCFDPSIALAGIERPPGRSLAWYGCWVVHHSREDQGWNLYAGREDVSVNREGGLENVKGERTWSRSACVQPWSDEVSVLIHLTPSVSGEWVAKPKPRKHGGKGMALGNPLGLGKRRGLDCVPGTTGKSQQLDVLITPSVG